jgi:hypothetical protein
MFDKAQNPAAISRGKEVCLKQRTVFDSNDCVAAEGKLNSLAEV